MNPWNQTHHYQSSWSESCVVLPSVRPSVHSIVRSYSYHGIISSNMVIEIVTIDDSNGKGSHNHTIPRTVIPFVVVFEESHPHEQKYARSHYIIIRAIVANQTSNLVSGKNFNPTKLIRILRLEHDLEIYSRKIHNKLKRETDNILQCICIWW